MYEREYKDFLRDGPAFFVYVNILEFLVFHGFLAQKGVFLPARQLGSWSPLDRAQTTSRSRSLKLEAKEISRGILGEDGILP